MPYFHVPNEALKNILDLVSQALAVGAIVRLYTNNPALDPDTVIGDFTELSTSYYSPATWELDAAVITPDKATYPAKTIVFDANPAAPNPTNVTGFYVTTPGPQNLLGCDSFAAPINLHDDPIVLFITESAYDLHA